MATSSEFIRELDPEIQPYAVALLAWLEYYGAPLRVVSGRRTRTEQAMLFALGKTRTLNSYHLSGRAFDVTFIRYGYTAPPEWWVFAGQVGEWLGLRWGGRFQGYGDLGDAGHFELP